jgi:mannose-6-phosphate isomerase
VLHVIEPRVGQCIFIPAGTVHALGGGLVVAEIQQSSDTTFRLFDWDRVGPDGQPRPLHIEQALAVTDFSIGPIEPQVPLLDPAGLEILVQCDKFVLRQAVLAPGTTGEQNLYVGGDHVPHVMTVVRGSVTINDSGGYQAIATAGQSALIPAASPRLRFHSDESTVVLFAELAEQ